jgi:predicted dienelactone hydrolase
MSGTQAARLILLAKRNQIPGDFTICMGMSGNGFKTDGTKIIMAPLLMAALGKTETAPIVPLAGEAGTVM